MDVALSIITGVGLRLVILAASGPNPANRIPTALLGVWEGGAVHQLASRSQSPPLDHALAYILRLAFDILLWRSVPTVATIGLCTAIGVLASESLYPYAESAMLETKVKDRIRERRHRHPRVVHDVPALSVPYPPRVRAYQNPPDTPSSTLASGESSEQQPQLSTPQFPQIPPRTPPSFFLHENSELSPAPKPIQVQTLESSSPFISEVLPPRPASALAAVLEKSPPPPSPLIQGLNLPTPPETAERSDPSDQTNEDYQENVQASRRLSTIHEASGDEGTPPDTSSQATDMEDTNEPPHSAPLPVPNRSLAEGTISRWLTSQANSSDPIFNAPFLDALPVPVPVRHRSAEPLWDIATPTADRGFRQGPDGVFEVQVGHEPDDYYAMEEAGVPMLTPGTKKNMETDAEPEGDPLPTPLRTRRQPTQPAADAASGLLSPLALDVNSGLNSDEELAARTRLRSNGEAILMVPPKTLPTTDEDAPATGTLSQNLLLQPPLPSSGLLISKAPSPPSSPETVTSDISNASALSTLVPSKLYVRGDEIRKEAWALEQNRSRIDAERIKAEHERRVADALRLKVQLREVEKEISKLHEKAARRYYAGELLSSTYVVAAIVNSL